MSEPNTDIENDITLRDYILMGKSYVHEILRYWYIPVLFALLGAAYKLYKYATFIPDYPARITFIVDEDEAGGSAGIAGILGQFGLGGMRPTRYNLEKILELSKSRRVVQHTLFSKITIDGDEDYIANHILRIYDIRLSDENGNPADGPYVFTHDSLPAFNREENKMLLAVYNLTTSTGEEKSNRLLSADYSEDTNIMSLTASTRDETLSIELARRMFESLSDYYIQKAIEKSQKTFTIVSTKRDSVLGELRAAEYALANFRDTHRGLLMRTDQITELRLQREVAALSAMYAEVLKNTEIADFSLRNKTPFIQTIDTPIAPLRPTSVSLLRSLAVGLLIGGFIGSLLILMRRVYLDVMSAP